ncbi:MAG: hypothetical protein LBC63_07425 [Holophagales bacterium]|jgi:hypothetical protein|nr:hypothetical protein [Holophagales bacterium]
MRVLHLLAIPALMASSFACKRAYHDFGPLGQPPRPMEVVVSIKSQAGEILINGKSHMLDLTTYERSEKRLTACLRDSLSKFVAVVPEGAIAPPESVRLEVCVYYCFESPMDTSRRLGYYSTAYYGELLLHDPKNSKTTRLGSIPALEIVREQKPLDDDLRAYLKGKGNYPESVRKSWAEQKDYEISRAFAETIAKQLQKKFGWQDSGTCSAT